VVLKQVHFSIAVLGAAYYKEPRIMTKLAHRSGMTLVEVLMTVTIIALLAVFLIPVANMTTRSRENAACANKLRTAVGAFELYASETGSYPETGTPGVIPPAMASYYFPYFKINWWDKITELGGKWSWNNGTPFKYSVSITSPTKSADQLTAFDKLIDDGNLSTGNFRISGAGYHYIIEQ
jgi:prepilin-type N-terminal cleavage/methylation domain-containing protein